jgi:hypothetical protein
MPEPQMRAADADREAVARRLGEHMAAGRLTTDEYEDRVARAYAARTFGELAELTADLPTGRGSSPAAPPQPAGACGPWSPWNSRSWHRATWASWTSTALIVTTIWLITSLASGAFLYFWPVWVIGPWGAVLLAQTFGGGPRSRRRPRDRHRLHA